MSDEKIKNIEETLVLQSEVFDECKSTLQEIMGLLGNINKWATTVEYRLKKLAEPKKKH